MSRTLQNIGLLLGVIRLRRRLQPVRTRALLISHSPQILRWFLDVRPQDRVLTAIGLERFTQAQRLIDSRRWSSGESHLFETALSLTRGELSKSAEVATGSGRLARRIAKAAIQERDFLTQIAANPRLQLTGVGHTVQRGLKFSQDCTVLHVLGTSLPFTTAGYNMRTQQLLSALLASGLKTAATTRLLYPVDRAVLNSPMINRVDSVEYMQLLPRRAPLERSAFQREWAERLTEVARANKTRLLHATTDFPNGVAALSAGNSLKIPVVYEVRGFLEESAQARLNQDHTERYELTRGAETSVMREVDAITTLSQSMAEEIANRGVPKTKIHVMPNAVEANWLSISTDASKLRAELDVADSEFLLGLFTTFSAHEGVNTLLEAVQQLRNQGVPVKCVLVGDGPTFQDAKNWVREHDSSKYVKLVGRLPRQVLPAWYQALDVFVLPRIDARVTQLVTPLKPIEAMALGVPVVCSAVGGLKEIVQPGVTGELFTPDDPADCAAAVQSLLYDSTRRKRLSEAAREWVAANRTWSQVAQRYVKLYQELGAI